MVKMTITYAAGHQYTETWTQADYYCPNCSNYTVWEGDGDDYYVGAQYICTFCSHTFYLPSIELIQGVTPDMQRLEALQNGS